MAPVLHRTQLQLALASASMILEPFAFAQSVVKADLQTNVSAQETTAAYPTNAAPSAIPADTNGENPPFWQWGPIELRPRAGYTLVRADGVQCLPGQPLTTNIGTLSVGIQVRVGDAWHLEYVPSWVKYSNPAFRDTLNQHVMFKGGLERQSWSIKLITNYSSTDLPLVQTGRQTSQQTFTADGAIVYWLLSNVMLSVNGDQILTFTKALADTYQWSGEPDITYCVTSRLRIGGGIRSGYVLAYRAADMYFLRPTAHIAWQLTPNTLVDVRAGNEHWRFVSGKHTRIAGPYYSASVVYQCFTATKIIFATGRSISTTPFRGQIATSETYTVQLHQRLLRHLRLDLSAQREKTKYLLNGIGFSAFRKDHLVTYDIKLNLLLFKQRGTLAATYRFNKNKSNEPGFGFSSNQYGVEASFRY